MLLKKWYLVIADNPWKYNEIFCDLVALDRAGATFLYPHMLIDDSQQLVFSAGNAPPKRLCFPMNQLNTKV